jgi:opacity protein-like surface antigen
MVLIFSVILSKSGLCQEITERYGLGYRYSYFKADDADYKSHGNVHDLIVSYGISEYLAVELEGGYFELKSKSGSEIGVLSGYTNLQVRAPIKEFVPYIVGGIGMQFYDYKKLLVDDRKDKDSSFSYKLGGGFEYFLTQDWAFNSEASYVYGNTGGEATLDVYGWRYSAGFKYFFE